MNFGFGQKIAVWATLGMVALFLITGTGCGTSDATRAKTAARDFVVAMDNDDQQGAEALLTEAARQKMAEDPNRKNPLLEGKSDSQGEATYTTGEPVITEDTASVPVAKVSGEDKEEATVCLRRENGAWKVYALKVPLRPGGTEVTLDFEHPEAMIGEAFKVMGDNLENMMKEAGKGMGEGMAAFMKGMGEGAAAFEKGYQEETARQEKLAQEKDKESDHKSDGSLIIQER
jgi:hypothetical protein